MISPRKSSQVKQGEKEIGERREPSVAWEKKGGGACRMFFDTHPSTYNYPVTHTSVTCQSG